MKSLRSATLAALMAMLLLSVNAIAGRNQEETKTLSKWSGRTSQEIRSSQDSMTGGKCSS
jgi:hypothetical protein